MIKTPMSIGFELLQTMIDDGDPDIKTLVNQYLSELK